MARRWKLATIAASLALVGASCTTSGPTKGGSVEAYIADFATLDPARCLETACLEILHRLFDPPVGYDPETAAIEPAAATTWVVSDDATEIILQLREGATFHNGEPVDAASFVRGLSRAAAAASEAASNLQGIAGLNAVQNGKADTLSGVREGASEMELIIELTGPDPEFILRMGHPVFSPMPEGLDEATVGESPVGNGPYQLVSFERGGSVAVEQYADYVGERPGLLESITWDVFADPGTAYTAFEDGDLAVAVAPRELFGEAETTYGAGFVQQPLTTDVLFLAAATSGAPTDDPNFRRAVSLALDRAEIVDSIFEGNQVAAASYIPPGTPGFRPDVCGYCVHDAAEAKSLLTEAGGAPAETLMLYAASPTHETWLQAASVQLEETLGLTVDVQIWDPSSDCGFFAFLAIAGPPNCGEPPAERGFSSGFFALSWGQDFPTPGHWLSLMESQNDLLFAGWTDEAFDDLTADARSTIDNAARQELVWQAEDRLLDQMPVLPLWYDTTGLVYDTDLIGSFPVDSQTGTPFWEEVALA